MWWSWKDLEQRSIMIASIRCVDRLLLAMMFGAVYSASTWGFNELSTRRGLQGGTSSANCNGSSVWWSEESLFCFRLAWPCHNTVCDSSLPAAHLMLVFGWARGAFLYFQIYFSRTGIWKFAIAQSCLLSLSLSIISRQAVTLVRQCAKLAQSSTIKTSK